MSDKQKPSKIYRMDGVPDDLKNIWDMTGEENPAKVVTEQETEEALATVWGKIDKKESYGVWRYYAAAAVILFTLAASYLMFYTKTIVAPVGEILSINMADGSKIELYSNSSISFKPLFGITHRNIELNGEAEFDVERNPNLAFVVSSPSITTTVLGTVFKVEDWKDAKKISAGVQVTEGKVGVASEINEVELMANQAVEFDQSSGMLGTILDFDDTRSMFDNGRITFHDVSIDEFFDRMQMYYNSNVKLQLNDSTDYRISGSYRISASLSEIINDIATVKGLQYQTTHNGFIISE